MNATDATRAAEGAVGPRWLARFTEGYLECALWASLDDEGNPLDWTYTSDNLSPEAPWQAAWACALFVLANVEDLDEAEDMGRPADHSGHDFWLTRNGHGAGFWDRGLGAVGDRLTASAESFGETDLYVGDDGLLYFS